MVWIDAKNLMGLPVDGMMRPAVPPAPRAFPQRLKGLVILGGAVHPSPFLAGIRRSPFDLPLSAGETLLDRWMTEAGALARAWGMPRISMQLMLDAHSIAPSERTPVHAVRMQVARDPFEFRGTGGVLHDVSRDWADDDYLLAANGAHLLVEPLPELVNALLARDSDVAILGHRDGTPSALMLIRCAALRDIAKVGFVDLKEQALPAIAKKYRVVVEERQAASLTLRTARDYLTALRLDHRRQRGEDLRNDPFAEDWRAEFSVIEKHATVHESARLFDSVVLDGGVVGPGAVLVRTIVCAGGHIKAGRRVVDGLAAAGKMVEGHGAQR